MGDNWHWLENSALEVAPRLLGCQLIRTINGKQMVGRIVETEAYDQTDAASHSYKGQTPRTDVMFGPAGHLYVYFTYGMHYCCNVTVGPTGHGAAVLIRALEPITGQEFMQQNRGARSLSELTNGPAKLCQALFIDRNLNGHDLRGEPLILKQKDIMPGESIVQTSRIGISREQDRPWRFYIKDNVWVSRRLPSG
jgi:DNA-3-methyladenine glycosylase